LKQGRRGSEEEEHESGEKTSNEIEQLTEQFE